MKGFILKFEKGAQVILLENIQNRPEVMYVKEMPTHSEVTVFWFDLNKAYHEQTFDVDFVKDGGYIGLLDKPLKILSN